MTTQSFLIYVMGSGALTALILLVAGNSRRIGSTSTSDKRKWAVLGMALCSFLISALLFYVAEERYLRIIWAGAALAQLTLFIIMIDSLRRPRHVS